MERVILSDALRPLRRALWPLKLIAWRAARWLAAGRDWIVSPAGVSLDSSRIALFQSDQIIIQVAVMAGCSLIRSIPRSRLRRTISCAMGGNAHLPKRATRKQQDHAEDHEDRQPVGNPCQCLRNGRAKMLQFVREGRLPAGQSATQLTTADLLKPGELFTIARMNLVDMRFAKILRFDKRRADIGIDLYNIFNSNVPVAYQTTYEYRTNGASWLTPTSIAAPRLARFSVTFNF